MMNHATKCAAARLIQRIDGRVDPFDVATGNDSSMREEFENLIASLGGQMRVEGITPGAAALYLALLMIVNSD